MRDLFFDLLKVALGNSTDITSSPGKKEWEMMFNMSLKQALTGILFSGIEKLPKEKRPNVSILLNWYNYVEQIKKRNLYLNIKCAELTSYFYERKIKSVILKGQGVAMLYPDPTRRISGDIDIWLEGGRKKLIPILNEITPKSGTVYHNKQINLFDDVEVEAHFTPSWLYSFIRNRRLQQYFKEQFSEQTKKHLKLENTNQYINVPKGDFNVIFILAHIYRHFFSEGIGLRQLVDYYYVLKEYNLNIERYKDREHIMSLLAKFGMYKFASAVMWIMQEKLGMEKDMLLCTSNAKEGKFLLNEIMIAGNFGHYDNRNNNRHTKIAFARFFYHIKRNTHFITHYPSEVLWTPLWKIWHYFWRRKNGYI